MADLQFEGSVDGILRGTWNDFQIDGNHDLRLVTGKDYAKQKLVKAMLTSYGTNFYFTGYGTNLSQALHQDINDPATRNLIVESILSTIQYLETVETSTDPAERILSVDDIQLTVDEVNFTIYVTIMLTLQNNETLSIILGG